MANDRIYLCCAICHADIVGSVGACIIKISGTEPWAVSGEAPAQLRIARFCEEHKDCDYQGFYLADEMGVPLLGTSLE